MSSLQGLCGAHSEDWQSEKLTAVCGATITSQPSLSARNVTSFWGYFPQKLNCHNGPSSLVSIWDFGKRLCRKLKLDWLFICWNIISRVHQPLGAWLRYRLLWLKWPGLWDPDLTITLHWHNQPPKDQEFQKWQLKARSASNGYSRPFQLRDTKVEM